MHGTDPADGLAELDSDGILSGSKKFDEKSEAGSTHKHISQGILPVHMSHLSDNEMLFFVATAFWDALLLLNINRLWVLTTAGIGC
jgi:hypothetical protein